MDLMVLITRHTVQISHRWTYFGYYIRSKLKGVIFFNDSDNLKYATRILTVVGIPVCSIRDVKGVYSVVSISSWNRGNLKSRLYRNVKLLKDRLIRALWLCYVFLCIAIVEICALRYFSYIRTLIVFIKILLHRIFFQSLIIWLFIFDRLKDTTKN